MTGQINNPINFAKTIGLAQTNPDFGK